MEQNEMDQLLKQAEEAFRQALSDAPERAEGQFLKALKIYDGLWSLTEDQKFSQAAGEVCQYLAEACMQQGNMHGADVFYVKAMAYAAGKKP